MKDKSFFCKQIKKIMLEKNFTQQDLADKLGITQTVVSRWVRGARNPSLNTIKKIAKIFNIPLNYFLEDYDDTKNKEKKSLSFEKILKKHEEEIQFLKDKIKVLEKKLKRKEEFN